MMPIRGISFDALGTLIKLRHGTVGAAYRSLALPFFAPSASSANATSQTYVLQQPTLSLDEGTLQRKFSQFFKLEMDKRGDYGTTPSKSVEFWNEVIGAVFADCFEGGVTPAEFKEYFYNLFETGKPYDLFPQSVEVLEGLKRKYPQVALTVVSNHDGRIRSVLKDLGVGEYFSAVVSNYEAKRPKPSPRGILLAAAAVDGGAEGGMMRRSWLHVGDSPDDMAAAAAAGCQFCGCDREKGITMEELERWLDGRASNL